MMTLPIPEPERLHLPLTELYADEELAAYFVENTQDEVLARRIVERHIEAAGYEEPELSQRRSELADAVVSADESWWWEPDVVDNGDEWLRRGESPKRPPDVPLIHGVHFDFGHLL